MTEANPVGRPTEYTQEFVDGIVQEFIDYVDRTQLPMWCEFCAQHKVNRRLASRMRQMSAKFRDAWDAYQAKYKTGLLKGGLGGKFVPSIVCIILKNEHDYFEKEAVKLDAGGFFESVVAKAAALRKKREAQEGQE